MWPLLRTPPWRAFAHRLGPCQAGPSLGFSKAFQCTECSQAFETEHALGLHVKYIHKSKED